MAEDDTIDKLNEALLRLTSENAAWRRKIEESEAVLRRRAPEASGLTMKASIITILDERDAARDRVQDFRNELKAILQMMINMDDDDTKMVNEIRKKINLFLFNNPR